MHFSEANYDQYISTFHPNCKVSTRGSLPRGINEWPKQGNEVRIGYIFDETVSKYRYYAWKDENFVIKSLYNQTILQHVAQLASLCTMVS